MAGEVDRVTGRSVRGGGRGHVGRRDELDLVAARDELVGRLDAVGQGGDRREQEAGEQQLDARSRGNVEAADGRAAGGAVAQVRADLDDVGSARGPGGQRRDRREVLLADLAGLDRLEDLHEPPPALGYCAIHLRVGPAEMAADLVVGVALGLEHQRAALVGLERAQRLGGAADPLAARGALVERALARLRARVEVELLVADRLGPGAADRHRLVLDDHLQPRQLGLRQHAVGAPQEDLERALVGVERVVVAEREVVGRPQQRPAVLGHHRRDAILRIRDPERRPSLHPSCSQRVPSATLTNSERKAGLLGMASWRISAGR